MISRQLSFRPRSRANFKIQDIGLHAQKGFRLGEITIFGCLIKSYLKITIKHGDHF